MVLRLNPQKPCSPSISGSARLVLRNESVCMEMQRNLKSDSLESHSVSIAVCSHLRTKEEVLVRFLRLKYKIEAWFTWLFI